MAINGLPFVQKVKSGPPKHLNSFIGQLIHFSVYASNSILGAVGLADFLIVASYFVDLLKKDNPYKDEETLWKAVKQELQSFIYSCNQPFRGGHQCVPTSYKVATPDGFKSNDELKVGDPIYVWKNNKMEVQPVLAINVYDYDGELDSYEIQHKRELLFTPEHRMFIRNKLTGEMYLQESEDVELERGSAFPTTAEYYDHAPYDITDEEIKIAIYYFLHGKTDGDGNLYIERSEATNRYPHILIGALEDKDLLYSASLEKNGYSIRLDSIVSEHIRKLLDRGDQIPSWAFKLSRYQSCLFIQTWTEAYGAYRDAKAKSKTLNLRAKNHQMQEELLRVVLQSGYTAKYGEWIQNDETDKKRLVVIANPSRNLDVRNKSKTAFKGQVWCPTTSAGIVMFKAEGVTFWTGNSGFYNVSLFDGPFLDKLCKDYVFEGGVTPSKETILQLQDIYIDLMNETLRTSPITFPVTSACFVRDDNNDVIDKDYMRHVAQKNLEYGFMNFYFGKTSTLSSCCRLRSDTNNEYFNSFGAGSSKIGLNTKWLNSNHLNCWNPAA